MPNRNIFNLLRILLSTALELIQHVEDEAPRAVQRAENQDQPVQDDDNDGFVLVDEPLPEAAP